MSAPTPAPGDDRPREGYYPDPSIPGYVRYWNGAAWVPGTSRPAPTAGEPLAPPPGAGAQVEETGPHFFDEDPAPGAQHGSRPEPASAWGADRSRQSGFGGDQDRRVSWGGPQTPDPRLPHTDGTAPIPPADPADAASPGTFVFRRPTTGQPTGDDGNPGGSGAPGVQGPAQVSGAPAGSTPGTPGPRAPHTDEGTMTFRALSPRTGHQQGAPGAHPGSTDASGAAGQPGGPGAGGFGGQGQASSSAPSAPSAPTAPAGPAFGAPAPAPGAPGFGAGKAAAARAAAGQAQAGGGAAQAPAAAPTALSGPQQTAPAGPQPAPAPAAPQQTSTPATPSVPQQGTPAPAPASASAPMTSGPGGGQPSWAQQVHRLAGAEEGQPVAPWKPPVEDIFQAAARRQAAARPAGLGKRLAARLIDTVVLVGVTGVAAVPLGTRALDHVNEKIDAAKLSGETVTVWLLDGTTSAYLGIVLAVLLLFGVLYEALPTAKWGRTLGKKLLGLEVRDIEAHEPPAFGPALRRWFVYSVPGLLGIGVVGVAWCLFDRPWHQCWHDKAARTFVAA